MKFFIAAAAAFGVTAFTLAIADEPDQGAELSKAESLQAMEQISQALTEAQAIPNYENGQFTGYKKMDAPQRQQGGIAADLRTSEAQSEPEEHAELTLPNERIKN